MAETAKKSNIEAIRDAHKRYMFKGKKHKKMQEYREEFFYRDTGYKGIISLGPVIRLDELAKSSKDISPCIYQASVDIAKKYFGLGEDSGVQSYCMQREIRMKPGFFNSWENDAEITKHLATVPKEIEGNIKSALTGIAEMCYNIGKSYGSSRIAGTSNHSESLIESCRCTFLTQKGIEEYLSVKVNGSKYINER